MQTHIVAVMMFPYVSFDQTSIIIHRFQLNTAGFAAASRITSHPARMCITTAQAAVNILKHLDVEWLHNVSTS